MNLKSSYPEKFKFRFPINESEPNPSPSEVTADLYSEVSKFLRGMTDSKRMALAIRLSDGARLIEDQSIKRTIWTEAKKRGETDAFGSWRSEMDEFDERLKKQKFWLKEILNAARLQDIKIVPLKGGLIGPALLKDFGYKKMNDFDFLITPVEIEDTIKMLKRLGFLSIAERLGLKEDFQNTHHTLPFYSPDRSLILGIHWNLVSPSSPIKITDGEVENLLRTEVELSDIGQAFRLPWEWHLWHICVHLPFYKTGIRELIDIFYLLERCTYFDWFLFLGITRKTSTQSQIYRTLNLADAVLGKNAIPLDVIHVLKNEVDEFYLRDTQARSELGPKLMAFRSTLPAKIEKCFAVSVISQDLKTRLKAWAASWKLTFFPSANEMRKIDVLNEGRVKVSLRILKLLQQDHGPKKFWALTFMNLGLVLLWLVRAPFKLNPNDPRKNEVITVLKGLE